MDEERNEEQTVTQEAQKEEALKRLLSLDLHENVTKDFKSGCLNKSEGVRMGGRRFGILYWLTDEEKRLVQKFEEEYEAVVYHVIQNYTEFGNMYSLLYVSKYSEEWEADREMMKNGEVYAYATVIDGYMGEIGMIGFEESGGGLIRVW